MWRAPTTGGIRIDAALSLLQQISRAAPHFECLRIAEHLALLVAVVRLTHRVPLRHLEVAVASTMAERQGRGVVAGAATVVGTAAEVAAMTAASPAS